MLLPLGVALDVVMIDAGLAMIALFLGFFAAIWYTGVSKAINGTQGDNSVHREIEAKANDAARSNMAAQQMRDLAKNMASDVGNHSTMMSGISNALGAVDADSPEANAAVSDAVTKILSANEKL